MHIQNCLQQKKRPSKALYKKVRASRVHTQAHPLSPTRNDTRATNQAKDPHPLRNNMTLLQNGPPTREAKKPKCRVPHDGKRSPDSESAYRELSKSSLQSHCGTLTCDFTSNSGGDTTTGAPKRTRVHPSRIHYATEEVSRTPYRKIFLENKSTMCLR
jgi:hypothetical protein